MVNEIIIEELHDEHDCETCGWSGAEGFFVTMPDGSEIDMTPVARCYDGTDYTERDLLIAVLEKLGYEVEWKC